MLPPAATRESLSSSPPHRLCPPSVTLPTRFGRYTLDGYFFRHIGAFPDHPRRASVIGDGQGDHDRELENDEANGDEEEDVQGMRVEPPAEDAVPDERKHPDQRGEDQETA